MGVGDDVGWWGWCEVGHKEANSINLSRACLLEFMREGSANKRQSRLTALATGSVGGPCDRSQGCGGGSLCMRGIAAGNWKEVERVHGRVAFISLLLAFCCRARFVCGKITKKNSVGSQ